MDAALKKKVRVLGILPAELYDNKYEAFFSIDPRVFLPEEYHCLYAAARKMTRELHSSLADDGLSENHDHCREVEGVLEVCIDSMINIIKSEAKGKKPESWPYLETSSMN